MSDKDKREQKPVVLATWGLPHIMAERDGPFVAGNSIFYKNPLPETYPLAWCYARYSDGAKFVFGWHLVKFSTRSLGMIVAEIFSIQGAEK